MRNNCKKVFILGALIFVMCGMFFGYDSKFQADSETLVTGPLRGRMEHVETGYYPLGRYSGVDGVMIDYSKAIDSQEWIDGYAPNEAAFIISNNEYTRGDIEKLSTIKDCKGDEYTVRDYTIAGDYVRINLLTNNTLNKKENGAVSRLQYFDRYGNRLLAGKVTDYKSQFGLQGMIFNRLAPSNLSYITSRNIARVICFVLLAIVLVLISYLIAVQFNWLLGGTFYCTFCTSPWIINYAPNLYWVEFTWFVPMLIGLAVLRTNMSFRYRLLAYVSAFLAITAKCLCGYEYISTIIIGMIMFPVVEGLNNWRNGNNRRVQSCMRVVMGLCCVGVTGFVIALAMHGYLRGEGDIYAGLHNIYQQDVLRRTWGGNGINYSSYGTKGVEAINSSLQASLVTVLLKYLVSNTSIAFGLPGRFFFFLILAPIIIYYYFLKKKKYLPWGGDIWGLYVMGFMATISWLTLAKAHSYIHVTLNFVLWYFGFVQVCLYCLLVAIREKAIEILKRKNVLNIEWQERLSK